MSLSSDFLLLVAGLLLAGLALAVYLLARERGRTERRARNLRALFEVSRQATANLDQQQMLDLVVQAVQEVMGYQMASVLLLDASRQELVSCAISSNLRGRIPVGDRIPIQLGMVGAAARSGRTQLANDVTRNPNYIRAPGKWDPGSELSVPLKSGGQVVGVLDVQDERRGAFNRENVQVLESLAEQLVVILENARLFEAERRRAGRTAAINAIGRLITASLSLDELLSTAVESIKSGLHYEDIALLLVDPDQPDSLVLQARSGVYQQFVSAGYRQSIHQGVIGRAVRTGQSVLVKDVTADPDYIPVPNADNLRVELAVPIRASRRVLGVLNVECDQPLTAEDSEGLEIIADQLAVAIENARLFADARSRLEDLSTLYELSRRLSLATDADQVMHAALEVLSTQAPYRCTIALLEFDPVNERPNRFYIPYVFQPGRGILHLDDYVPTGEDELNPLLDQGQTVAIADVTADPRVPDYLRQEQVESGRPALVLIPLIIGRSRIGNLVLSHTQAHVWSESELRLYRLAANLLAGAIENTRRLERERIRTERLNLIARAGQRIAARLDPDGLLSVTAHELRERLEYDHVAIFLLDPAEPDVLVQRARASLWPRGESVAYRQLISQGIIGAAARSGKAVLVNDVASDPRYIPVPGADIRAELALPILLGKRLLGVLDLAGTRRFGDQDLEGLNTIADQLAIALENASLYERAHSAAILEERQRLARDLHDSVTQLVFSVLLIAQSIGPAYRRDPEEGERRIGRVLELSQQALTETRALLNQLRPMELAAAGTDGLVTARSGMEVVRSAGLVAALKQLISSSRRDGLNISLDDHGYAQTTGLQQLRLPPEFEEALYRITQEALNNMLKHSRASKVEIHLFANQDPVQLSVKDDGVGFSLEHAGNNGISSSASGGMGLTTMRERAEALGGVLQTISTPGQGVTLQVSIPRRKEEDS